MKNMTPEKQIESCFPQCVQDQLREGHGSNMSSKTMFLNGFQLGSLMKFDNTFFYQVGTETDPGRRQERRKQCASEFKICVSFSAVV